MATSNKQMKSVIFLGLPNGSPFSFPCKIAANNLNLQVINPLWLVLGLQRGRERAGFWIVLFFSALSLLMPLLPPWQYTLDVLAAFLPLNLAAAWVLYRSSRSVPGA